ncbi:hypothetical protein ACHWQZ_G001591 [Mnemiopsis leidyi]
MRLLCDDTRRPEYELFKAVQDCNLREVRRLLREGANPNSLLKRKGGLSAFHLSVGLSGSKALEIVAVLLDGNANPNNRAFDGLTPLHIAAMWGHLQAVELLVNSDADIEICDNDGKTALMLSRDMGQYHVSRYLDKLQRHIVTAVCEAEEACSKMDQTRHSQVFNRQSSNILSQSEDSDNNSVKNNNIKLNIQPNHSRTKTDAYTQFPDGPQLDRIRWTYWVKEVAQKTAGIKNFGNIHAVQSLNTPDIAGYSAPLSACLRGYPMRNVVDKVEEISESFPPGRQYFNYLLLDSRYTKNLPCRATQLPLQECFRVFCGSLFHVGCGNKSRPLAHVQDAVGRTKDSEKVRRIRTVWNAGYGVVSLSLQPAGLSQEDTLTRQALIVSALGLQNVTNARGGVLHPPFNSLSSDEVAELGVVILFRAMLRYLSAGEKQWFKHELV